MSVKTEYKTFSEVEKILLSKHILIKKNGIDFLYPILERLDNPHKKLGKVIHITGTNGKGSTSVIMESVLRNSGYKTALYTSPHIFNLRERIKINNIDISENDFLEIFNYVYPHCEKLSFFEIMTIIAFVYFSRNKVDFSIIEVGIGGKYDTTNVIEKSEICLITSISKDHVDLLGNSPQDIAKQKAGIVKKGSICLYPELSADVEKQIIQVSKENGGLAYKVKEMFEIEKINPNKNSMVIRPIKKALSIKDKSDIVYILPIIGIAQTKNVSLVRKAVDILNEKGYKISEINFKKGLSKAIISSRFQIFKKKFGNEIKTIIVDGAHNEEAVDLFLNNLRKAGIKKPVALFSILNTKDYRPIIRKMAGFFDSVIFTKINSEKNTEPELLADEFFKYKKEADIYVIDDIEIALKRALNFREICIFGSFYLASSCLKIIKGEK